MGSVADANETKWPFVYVFFLDIVKFSLEGDLEQKRMVETVISTLASSGFFSAINKEKRYAAVYGDGILVVFPDSEVVDPFKILDFSVEIQKELKKKKIPVRIGLNCGNAFKIMDINGRLNYVGTAINDAQRVMDIGDEKHILIHQELYKKLHQRDPDRVKKVTSNLGSVLVKHGHNICVYNFLPHRAGNPKMPRKARKNFIVGNLIQEHLAITFRHVEDYLKKDIGISPGTAKLRMSILLLDEKAKGFYVTNYRYQHKYGEKGFEKPEIIFKNRSGNPVYNAYNNLRPSHFHLPLFEDDQDFYIDCWRKEFRGITKKDILKFKRPSSCYMYIPLYIKSPGKNKKPIKRIGVLCVDALCKLGQDHAEELIEYIEGEKIFIEYLLSIIT